MRRYLVLIPAALFLSAAPAGAANFDGTYNGRIIPTPGMSGPACNGAPLTFTVTEGRFSAKAPSIDGFVNIKGFVTGKLKTDDGRMLPFEGRVDDPEGTGAHRLVAGVVDDANQCAWTMDLAQQ